MKKEKNDFLVVFIFGILLCYFSYTYVLRDLEGIYSDYNGHTYVYLPMFTTENWVEGWMMVPYCMWHLVTLFFNKILFVPIQSAAAYTTSVFILFAYIVMYWMIRRVTEAAGSIDSSLRAAVISFGVCVLRAFSFYWLDEDAKYSMNPIYNPTYMCMRGFSLLCFCLLCDIWGRQKDENYRGIFFRVEKGLKRYYIYLAIMLFLSAMAKPTFAEMFIPAVAFLMLGELLTRLRRRDGSAAPYFRHCVNTLLCAVPTLLYILLQFLVYFIWGGSYGGEEGLVVTKWLEVWRMYTQNVGLSILCSMAFPLFMLLIDGAYFVKSDWGRLALAGYLMGFLEAALLGEGGEKLGHGDFLWPMMSGLLLMFIVSLMRLLVLERTQADTRGKRILLAGAWFLFCIHVLYGILALI